MYFTHLDFPTLEIPMLFFGGCIYFFARLWPIWNFRNQGCDLYYFLLCAEEFKKNKKLPIVLPEYFLLEPKEQWYPPVFSVFLSFFSKNWLSQYHWVLNHIVDFFSVLLFYFMTSYESNFIFAFLLLLGYALQGPMVMEFRALNSRPLGMLIFNAFLFSFYFYVLGKSVCLVLAIFFGVMLFYTHKLSMQLLWFLLPFLSITLGDIRWVLVLPSIYLGAFLLNPGLFRKIIIAHLDIITFWGRNWHLLGAHSVLQSPIYGDKNTELQFYRKSGIKGIFNLLRTMTHLNYWAIFVLIALFEYQNLTFFEKFLVFSTFGIYFWGISTSIFPVLRSMGLGQQYIKYACLPSLGLTASILYKTSHPMYWFIALLCLLLTARQYWMVSNNLRKENPSNIGHLSFDMEVMVAYINTISEPRLMCLPFHYADLLAYFTRKPVLWGTHGFGFCKAEVVFPVLRKKIAELISEYGLTHILLKRGYCELDKLGLNKDAIVKETDSFWLISL